MTLHLETERLLLRPFVKEDHDWILAAMRNDEVARWIPLLPYPYGAAEASAFLTLQTGANANALAVLSDGVGIGCITTKMELGYWFVQSAWGKGFATEAARATVAQYFSAGHDQMESGYILGNQRSAGVLNKLGFVPTHQVTRPSNMTQTEVIVQRMTLTRADWEAQL